MTAPPRPHLVLIAALARNRCIGKHNQLLWHLPEDLAHFKRHTQGCPVIMGRKTWDSLPPRFRPLPGRLNIVVSRQPGLNLSGAQVVSSVPQALSLAALAPRVYVIGGEQLYAAALPLADELLLTEIDQDFEGDTFFPAWAPGDFVRTQQEAHQAAAPNAFAFSFNTYQRSPTSTSPRS
jgi:dihydrofolate reductase